MTKELIEKYGDQAYHQAVLMAIKAIQTKDDENAWVFSESARELMLLGYAENPIKNPNQNQITGVYKVL